nr:hypothetical protein [Microbacterium sp. ZXX196]
MPTHPAAPAPAPQAPKRARNVLGLIALIAAALGFIFACIPGAVIVGWILLPISFILGIVAVFLRGKSKWEAITAICLSIVGTIVGVIVFVVAMANIVSDSFDESFSEGDTVVTDPSTDGSESESSESEDAESTPAEGSRENPLPFDATFENDSWAFEFTSFTPDANQIVVDGNPYNDAPGEGEIYVMAEAKATYLGDDEGSTFEVNIDYVTADGNVVSTWDNIVAGVEPEFGSESMYNGASDEGKLVFLVPDSVDGLLRVEAGMFADAVFFELP